MAEPHSHLFVKGEGYKALSRLMDYPFEDAGILLARNGGVDQLKALNDPVISEHLERLGNYLKECDLEELQTEYTRLFIYRPVCPPNETAYRDDLKAHQLIEKLDVCYAQAGLELSETLSPDHISVELEFMHYLLHRQGASPDSEANLWKEQASSFKREHLLRWVLEFCAKLHDAADKPFYHLASVMAAFVKIQADGRDQAL